MTLTADTSVQDAYELGDRYGVLHTDDGMYGGLFRIDGPWIWMDDATKGPVVVPVHRVQRVDVK
jgi:hypothetical protein